MTNRVSAVAFDIDGTLYPNSAMYRATALLALRHLRLFRAFGEARKEVRREHHQGPPPRGALAQRTVALTAERLGWTEEKTAGAIGTIIYDRWEQTLKKVSLYPGARELLVWLQDQGVPLGAMSDFPTESKLRILGLEGLWDVAFSSEETETLKPHRAPFDKLAHDLGVPAEEILYVGNSYDYDVLGAASAGMQTAHLTRKPVVAGKADFSFFRFSALREWLEHRVGVSARS
ncbi:HAD family hydrolase [Alkalispirochaeta americana]|uniref:HAD family hydrolase n=1 Tax=Alkalispirochaeta americana TaxID=159291 RepID=UPI000970DE9A|nr:HAD family hydrolase [Alkalispirochaeta americana]